MKKETIEEAAANLVDPSICKTDNWIAGAKWQAERMYSEEDMEEAFTNGLNRSFDSDFDRWLEHYEKK